MASWLAVYDLPQELFSLLDSGERSLLEISWKIKHDSGHRRKKKRLVRNNLY